LLQANATEEDITGVEITDESKQTLH